MTSPVTCQSVVPNPFLTEINPQSVMPPQVGNASDPGVQPAAQSVAQPGADRKDTRVTDQAMGTWSHAELDIDEKALARFAEQHPPSQAPCKGGVVITAEATALGAALLGVGIQLNYGIALHRDGVALVSSHSSLPLTCEDVNGDYVPCTLGVGASAGVGVNVQYATDLCKLQGEGTVLSADGIPKVSPAASFTPYGELVAAGATIGLGVGKSVSAVRTTTDVTDLFGSYK